MNIDPLLIRKQFPIYDRLFHGKPIAYLDNAATTLKPERVVNAMSEHYLRGASNVHRGVYELSEVATKQFEDVRDLVKEFINARDRSEVVFTSGTTESINLVAQTFGRTFLKSGDEVLITEMEHHSNIVPWQLLEKQIGIKIKVIPIDQNGALEIDKLNHLVSPQTKLISFVYVSNSLGTLNPAKQICDFAKERGIRTLIDSAQAMTFLPIDVQDLGCDFLCFSSHKMFGPTGVGVLYGQQELLNEMPPYKGGGDMIKSVTFEKTIFNDPPYKFEAGTPNIGGVIGFGEAIRFLQELGHESILRHDQSLLQYATDKLAAVEGLRIIGTAEKKGPVIGFWFESAHPHDIGTLLDQQGIAVRTGHHCTQPVMKHFNVPATVRASFSIYNTLEDVDRLVDSLKTITRMFQ